MLGNEKKEEKWGAKKCAESHVFCAISHTQHNGFLIIFAKTTRNVWKQEEKY